MASGLAIGTLIDKAAGLQFPVLEVAHQMATHFGVAKVVTPAAALFMTAVLEIMCGEMIELACNAALQCCVHDAERQGLQNRSEWITPKHLTTAISADEEVQRLFSGALGTCHVIGGDGINLDRRWYYRNHGDGTGYGHNPSERMLDDMAVDWYDNGSTVWVCGIVNQPNSSWWVSPSDSSRWVSAFSVRPASGAWLGERVTSIDHLVSARCQLMIDSDHGTAANAAECEGGDDGSAFISSDQLPVYEALWCLAVPGPRNHTLGPAAAVDFLTKSGFDNGVLGTIWATADVNEPKGTLNKQEFFVALKLIAVKQAGESASMDNINRKTDLPALGRHTAAAVANAAAAAVSLTKKGMVSVMSADTFGEMVADRKELQGTQREAAGGGVCGDGVAEVIGDQQDGTTTRFAAAVIENRLKACLQTVSAPIICELAAQAGVLRMSMASCNAIRVVIAKTLRGILKRINTQAESQKRKTGLVRDVLAASLSLHGNGGGGSGGSGGGSMVMLGTGFLANVYASRRAGSGAGAGATASGFAGAAARYSSDANRQLWSGAEDARYTAKVGSTECKVMDRCDADADADTEGGAGAGAEVGAGADGVHNGVCGFNQISNRLWGAAGNDDNGGTVDTAGNHIYAGDHNGSSDGDEDDDADADDDDDDDDDCVDDWAFGFHSKRCCESLVEDEGYGYGRKREDLTEEQEKECVSDFVAYMKFQVKARAESIECLKSNTTTEHPAFPFKVIADLCIAMQEDIFGPGKLQFEPAVFALISVKLEACVVGLFADALAISQDINASMPQLHSEDRMDWNTDAEEYAVRKHANAHTARQPARRYQVVQAADLRLALQLKGCGDILFVDEGGR